MIAAGSCHTGGPVLSLDGLDCPPLIATLALAIRHEGEGYDDLRMHVFGAPSRR
jgi:hypothetical protein